jgi:hypothetical protein
MQPVPGHPYASYGAQTDAYGRYFIHCACSACGDRTIKRCMNPQRTNYWVMNYAQLHAHGLRPRAR